MGVHAHGVLIVISYPANWATHQQFCHQPKEFSIGTEEFQQKKLVGKKEKTATKKMAF